MSLRPIAKLIATALLASPLSAQARPDIIRGRVTTDSGAAIPGADVIVTVAPTAETIRASTDSSGDYSVSIPNPTGEYIVYITALGRRPMRQRVTRSGPTDSVFVVDARLAPAIATIAAVRVQATRPRPARIMTAPTTLSTDPLNKTVDGVVGAQSPDLAGNLDALAQLVPGIAVTPGGASAFGMSSDANRATINGVTLGAADLPREARTATSFLTAPWDPATGGFAGVSRQTTVSRGSNVSGNSARASLDVPPLQFSDAVAASSGQKFTNILGSAGGTGAFRLDKYFHSYGVQASRNSADVSSLLDLDPDALTRSGIAPGAAASVLDTLAARGIPTSARFGGQRATTRVSFVERIDYAVPTIPPSAVPRPQWSLMGLGSYARSDALSLSPTTPPAFGGETANINAALQATYSRFIGSTGDYLNETTSALSLSDDRSTPYVDLPSGSVRIASTLADGSLGLGSLPFGGNSTLRRDTKDWTWELINQTSFLPTHSASFPVRITLHSRLDGFSQERAANRLGSFTYASLGELETSKPSTFSRVLDAPSARGGQWLGGAAATLNWQNPHWAIVGGARVDANAFTSRAPYNAAITQTFGVRNDHAPSAIAVSPRLGVTWYPARPFTSMSASQVGTVSRGGKNVRFGVGKFRSYYASSLLADAMVNAALPGSARRLLCVGDAVPVADWSLFAAFPDSIPRTCAGGVTNLADTARAVTLFDRAYAPQTSWRATLGWTLLPLNNYIAVDAAYSLNEHQPGVVDLNFAGVPRFTLAAEGNRPVYVSAASITSGGAVSPVEARSSQTFGRVSNRVSDLKGDARQLTVYVIPNIPSRSTLVTLGYTYASARSQSRGFDQTTEGDPRRVEWAPSPFTPRHQLLIGIGRAGRRFGVTSFIRATSGLPYTPGVIGDLNGDGSFNDRAYVFDPTLSTDTAVANGLTRLLSSGTRSARNCLGEQIGRIARRASCVGPWGVTMNARLAFYRPIPKTSLSASINFANPLGGVDRLLHGTKLRGWGALPVPDATLYQVRGFDSSTKQFLYQVNSRFGTSDPATTVLRAPFRISLELTMPFGRNFSEQSLEQSLRVRPSLLGTRAPADTLKAREMRGMQDIYALILRFADSLAISRDQFEKLSARQSELRVVADSIFTDLATYLHGLPSNYNVAAAVKRQQAARDSMWAHIRNERGFLASLLTPGQIRLLWEPVQRMVNDPKDRGTFSFGGTSYGDRR